MSTIIDAEELAAMFEKENRIHLARGVMRWAKKHQMQVISIEDHNAAMTLQYERLSEQFDKLRSRMEDDRK